MGSIATSQLKGPWLLSVQSFACSPHVCMGVSWVLQFPHVQKLAGRQIGNSELPLGVTEFVNVCVCEFSLFTPTVTEIGSGTSVTLTRRKKKVTKNELKEE